MHPCPEEARPLLRFSIQVCGVDSLEEALSGFGTKEISTAEPPLSSTEVPLIWNKFSKSQLLLEFSSSSELQCVIDYYPLTIKIILDILIYLGQYTQRWGPSIWIG